MGGGDNLVFVQNCIIKDNQITCDLGITDKIFFEKNAIYPLSKRFDKKGKVHYLRFLQFLEWNFLKNIDFITEFFDM